MYPRQTKSLVVTHQRNWEFCINRTEELNEDEQKFTEGIFPFVMDYCKISLFVILARVSFTVQEIDFNKIITNTTSGYSLHENILCRSCGNDITFSSGLINKISPFSEQSYHDSLFSKDEVLIQVFISDLFLPYPMITTNQSTCVGITEWEEADSWYPGYHWKPCVCPKCGTLVGWVFEPINPTIADQPDQFFGHILATLIGESFLNSLAPRDLSNN